jgi:2,4-dienoyl-CoA reductase (NADPH2)
MLNLLFNPFKIKDLEVRNRVVMPAFGLLYTSDRKVSQRLLDFYEARSAGGCGLIIVGGCGIDFIGGGPMMLGLDDDSFIPGYEKLAQAVHKHGGKLFLQLFHSGRYQFSFLIGQKSVGPSVVRSRYTKEEPRELAHDEIIEIEKKFANAALRAKQAGADGVELISNAGYLINQFLSPVTNLRTDEYGGSFEKRATFPLNVISRVREKVGADYAVTMRIGGNDFIPGGNTNHEMSEYAKIFCEKGIDAINVTGGWHETKVPQLPMAVPPGAYTYLALGIKRKVKVPVYSSNRIFDPEQAEKVLLEGWADAVCIGRGQIADPEWANKAKEGRAEEIRPCVGCMQGCMDRLFTMKPVECLANACSGWESERRITAAPQKKRVLVVGGGPAGCEAAMAAKARGHEVELWEADEKIGGQLFLAGAPPGREDFLRLAKFYASEVKRVGVKIKLKRKATLAKIQKAGFDEIIIATGAKPIKIDLPGMKLEHVHQAWEVLKGNVKLGEKVVVIGGGSAGIETAIYAASQGTITGDVLKFLMLNQAETVEKLKELLTKGSHSVTLIEMLDKLGPDMGVATRWVLLQELATLGVKQLVKAKVLKIKKDEVVYELDGKELSEPADTVIMALGATAERKLAIELEKAGVKFKEVGDVTKPRKIMDAVHEGYLAGSQI